MNFDVAILGAGITGLSTAHALSRHPELKVALLEQFSVGHPFGGSHGTSRILRSVYSHPGYVKLIQRAYHEEWPRLEEELGSVFIHPNPCCCFGRGKIFENYLNSIGNYGLDIDILDIPSARRLFPQFRFQGVRAVLHDRTGGVLAAQEILHRLKESILKRGVQLREKTKVSALHSDQDSIRITTDRGTISTQRLVIAAGAWIPKLIPALHSTITPIRQTVGYFKLQGKEDSYQISRFPNWAFIGEEENELFYGLPQFGCEGIKAARHVTAGMGDDPNLSSDSGDPLQITALEEFIREHFMQPLERLLRSETCFYANAPEEGFILDLLPEDPRIVIGSVCSGHGFKFAPLTGRILAELALDGKTTVQEFEEFRKLFSILPREL